VISRVTYVTSESEMEQMTTSCRFYGPNTF
jgi:hypothetical protein